MLPGSLLRAAILLISSIAAKAYSSRHPTPCPCLSGKDVDYLVNAWEIVHSQGENWEQVAKDTMTDDFQKISDSISFDQQSPLNETTYTSREEYLSKDIRAYRPSGPIAVDFVTYNCDTITLVDHFVIGGVPIRGVGVLLVDTGRMMMYKSIREFNNGAALHAMGGPECQKNFTVSVGKEGVNASRIDCWSRDRL